MLALADSTVSLVVSLVSAFIAISSVVWAAATESRRQAREHGFQREQRDQDRAYEAKKVLRTFREPLVFAADQLVSRIDNMRDWNFLSKYGALRSEYVVDSTLFAFADLLGWMETMRLGQQYLDLGDEVEIRQLNERVAAVGRVLSTDSIGTDAGDVAGFMIWRQEQRAIGELMVERVDGVERRLGYASFVSRLRGCPEFSEWFEHLRVDAARAMDDPSFVLPRLEKLAVTLQQLIDHLDPNRVRAIRRGGPVPSNSGSAT